MKQTNALREVIDDTAARNGWTFADIPTWGQRAGDDLSPQNISRITKGPTVNLVAMQDRGGELGAREAIEKDTTSGEGELMGGWPNDTDAKKAIKALVKTYGWIYDTDVGKSAHHTGNLLCGDGCRTPVFSTGRNTGRALWTFALRCTHGHRPSTRSP